MPRRQLVTLHVTISVILTACGGSSRMAPGDADRDSRAADRDDAGLSDLTREGPQEDRQEAPEGADHRVDGSLGEASSLPDGMVADAASDLNRERGPDGASLDGRSPDGGAADLGASCDPPAALMVPGSDEGEQPYDVAMAYSPTAGIGVLLSRWPSAYQPQFATFQPATRTFGPTGTITSGQGNSTTHVALAALSDGRLAAAWAADTTLYASIGPETTAPLTQILSYDRNPVPSVAISTFGDDRIAVAWADVALVGGIDRDVVKVHIADLALGWVDEMIVVPIGTGRLSATLFSNGAQLFVLITQLLVNDTETAELSMAKIAVSNRALTPAKHLMTHVGSGGWSSPAFTATTVAFSYPTTSDIMFAMFDLDGNAVGVPQAVIPNADQTTPMNLFWDGTDYHLFLFTPVPAPTYALLRYAKLDANHRALPLITIGNMSVPRSVGLFKIGSALTAGWFSMDAAYLSPLCP
jgi:hypothetical protein